jgi:ribosomal protein L35
MCFDHLIKFYASHLFKKKTSDITWKRKRDLTNKKLSNQQDLYKFIV